ncbi:Serine/threonine-protein kinase ATG1 [Nemania sp. FL0031]|nr:Serine/threonine-protein kinase ATG1 [Nemania sp. FL0031]
MAEGRVSSRRAKTGDDDVGQFLIGSEIGKGSFAQVYMGKHKVSGEAVAIKSVELARLNKKLKENLYSEIKILKKLRHPHIVALHDCVESSTHINLIMEYCELGDLSLFIKKRDKLITHPATCDLARKYPSVPGSGLNEVVIRHFLKQLASALQFLREGNFVHRDIKPQNLLLLPSVAYRESNRGSRPILSASQDSLIPAVGLQSLPMLKLADFGFARVLPSTSLAETLCGSPLYMAPEILRYERYDAKADLWSVGTVAFEMISGKPPFRASNHVELLRKIEGNNDNIKFPKEVQVTSDLKALIRALLRRNPVERMSFENFFNHDVIADPIPGLVEDDLPKSLRLSSKDSRALSKTDEPRPQGRRLSTHHRYRTDTGIIHQEIDQASPRERPLRSSPLATTPERENPGSVKDTARVGHIPQNDIVSGLGIQRPQPVPSTSSPSKPILAEGHRNRGYSNASINKISRDDRSPPASYVDNSVGKGKEKYYPSAADDREKVAHDIAFERDYVVVEKKHVEVNAFADELAAKGTQPHTIPQRPGQGIRSATQQGDPRSTTGAVSAQPSNALQISQGRQRPDSQHRGSYEKNASGSPGSTTSVISKAIQDASLRLFGFKYPSHMLGKGASPPHMYSPFPAYPTPNTMNMGLITDGRQGGPIDEDLRVAQCIEELATRSDVVWGFAEVKYKQLVPLAPSTEEGLDGMPVEKMGDDDDEGLTIEAIVVLSEEALVLYVKALSLLAKSMDIASIWWARKARGESTITQQHIISRDPISVQNLVARVNSAVQWIRRRFNETLEKAEIVRLKLTEAQKQLPEDHVSHPSNNLVEAVVPGTPGVEGIVLTPGLSAEKLMYDRAIEMSRTAAINEIANEDLKGCELSYLTAIQMLKAILDNDEDISRKGQLSGSPKPERDIQGVASEINQDDQQAVHKMIQMITARLSTLQKKIQMIANASKSQSHSLSRKRSGETTPRSITPHPS